jgi:ribosome-associated toxin RatA of RatAB toxin-antitoxin module
MDASGDPIPIFLTGSRNGEYPMVVIAEAVEVDASADEVWDIVSDVDRDPEYWNGLTSIRNIRKEGNLIEREVLVGFMGRKGTQRIELVPKEFIQLTMIDGPLRGSREIRLVPLGAERTKIDISWDIQFSAIPDFAQGFVRSRLEEGTREALERIAKAVQARKK